MIGPTELHTHAHSLGRREAQEQTETPTNGIDTDLDEQVASEEGGKEDKEEGGRKEERGERAESQGDQALRGKRERLTALHCQRHRDFGDYLALMCTVYIPKYLSAALQEGKKGMLPGPDQGSALLSPVRIPSSIITVGN